MEVPLQVHLFGLLILGVEHVLQLKAGRLPHKVLNLAGSQNTGQFSDEAWLNLNNILINIHGILRCRNRAQHNIDKMEQL